MFYENYLSNLKKNVMEVNRALKGGVVLTRLEHFDYLFKKELMIAEGIMSDKGFFKKIFNDATNIDYRLANFYARCFKEMFNTIKKGYSVSGLEKQYKSFIKVAHSKYICSKLFKVNITDNNGRIKVLLKTGSSKIEDFEIVNMQDYISFTVFLISLLGSYDEQNNGYKDWFNSYLAKEFRKINRGVNPKPFIEKVSVARDLHSYVSATVISENVVPTGGKVIPLKNNII